MSVKLTIALFILFASQSATSQELITYNCDKSFLSDSEYKKCILDSIWSRDIIVKTNYISFLQTIVLPQFRQKRKNLQIPAELEIKLKRLRLIYDSTLDYKLKVIKSEMYKNQQYVQPKAYISTLLSLEHFHFYPDMYAVLLNEIHLELTPKTSSRDFQSNENVVRETFRLIPKELYDTASIYSKDLESKKKVFPQSEQHYLFQGDIDSIKREKLQLLNFLLWSK